MKVVLLLLQIFIVAFLSLLILVQRTGSDGLSGLSGGAHNFISNKASNSLITKLTMIAAIAFMINSLVLAKYTIYEQGQPNSIIESIETKKQQGDKPTKQK